MVGQRWCLGICFGALALLSGGAGTAWGAETGRGEGDVAQAQAGATPGGDGSKVESKRIGDEKLPATDSSALPLLWLPLATAAGLAVITVGIAALVRTANSEDEARLARVADNREPRHRPPLPPPRPGPLSGQPRARIATAWRVLGRSVSSTVSTRSQSSKDDNESVE
jgi:hypothetical protein